MNRKTTYGEAILEGFEYLLEKYPEVFVIGQGLWSPWYVGNSMTDLDKMYKCASVNLEYMSMHGCLRKRSKH